MIAESIIAAAKDFKNIPIIVRLQGTNAAEGQKMVIGSVRVPMLQHRWLILSDRGKWPQTFC